MGLQGGVVEGEKSGLKQERNYCPWLEATEAGA